MAALFLFAGAGYWWLNRPPERYKPDNGGLYPINVNGKYGFMDRSGKTIIKPQFDMAFGFSEGLAQVRIGNKSGYIDNKGLVVISPQFDAAMEFQYGRAAVKLCCGGEFWQLTPGTRYGFIDKDGKYIASPTFQWVGVGFSGDLAPVKTAEGSLAFLDRSGKVVLAGRVDSLLPNGFTEGLAPASAGGKWGFIDTSGKWIIDPQFEYAWNFADGMAPVKVGGKVGYIDKRGRYVVNPQYDSGYEFYDGYAIFANDGKFGFIDSKGHVVSDAKFLGIGPFSEGLALAGIAGGWGFIDQTGKMVIGPGFDSADGFLNGLAKVIVSGKEAYVTNAGKLVVDPFSVLSPDVAHIDPAYRAMVQDWLRRNPRFGALALMSDCSSCRKGGDYEAWGRYDKDPYWDNKHPYYAAGDFNKDGQADVAIVSKHGDLVIFNGPLRVGTTGQFVGNIRCGRATDLGQCNLDTDDIYIYYKAKSETFICGVYGSEGSCSVRSKSGDDYLFYSVGR